jgi:hypothetical protein
MHQHLCCNESVLDVSFAEHIVQLARVAIRHRLREGINIYYICHFFCSGLIIITYSTS